MKALVACEESQTVTKALRAIGVEAYSCDVVDQSGGHPEWHLKQDVLPLLSEAWDLVIAHPPCTYLSVAGAAHLYRGGRLNQARYEKGLAAKKFFMACLNANAPHVAVENPVQFKIFELPPYTQQVQPYEFGHPYTKKTRLWLRGLPALVPTNVVEPERPWIQRGGNGYRHGVTGARSAKVRSKTFDGIAQAMAEQWALPIMQGEI